MKDIIRLSGMNSINSYLCFIKSRMAWTKVYFFLHLRSRFFISFDILIHSYQHLGKIRSLMMRLSPESKRKLNFFFTLAKSFLRKVISLEGIFSKPKILMLFDYCWDPYVTTEWLLINFCGRKRLTKTKIDLPIDKFCETQL